jgi:hypothetical protein
MRFVLALASTLLCAALASGCSTPQPVKDTATYTAWMMGQVDGQVAQFRVDREAVDAKIASEVGQARVASAESRKQFNRLMRTLAAGGSSKEVELVKRMQALSDALLADNLEFRATQAQIEAEMADLLAPLPSVSQKVSSAVGAVSAFGQDRSAKAQFEELKAAWKAVADTTKDNRDKLKKAANPTP